MNAPHVDAPSPTPSKCPACTSTDITTASKVVNEETYWRCRACGEVWNVGRRQDAPAWRGGRRW